MRCKAFRNSFCDTNSHSKHADAGSSAAAAAPCFEDAIWDCSCTSVHICTAAMCRNFE
jgi:hypothetical protein